MIGTSFRVLVVDDELPWAQLVAEWLRQSGHSVDVATSAEAGLARIQEEAFDVVLVDMVMPPPGMDGKQTREWNKIFNEVERGRFDGARHKLDEFEERYGATDETRALRPQLDALGPDVRGRPEGRGRGKKHRDDD